MALKGVHHVGILVEDLPGAEAFLGDVLGLEAVKRVSIPEAATEACFYDCGGVRLELISISDPEVRAGRGRVGSGAEIEHVAIAVDDVEAEAARMRERGVRFAAGGELAEETTAPLDLGGARSLFSYPEGAAGLIWQLIEEVE